MFYLIRIFVYLQLEKNCEDAFVNYGISGALKVYIVNCKSEVSCWVTWPKVTRLKLARNVPLGEGERDP